MTLDDQSLHKIQNERRHSKCVLLYQKWSTAARSICLITVVSSEKFHERKIKKLLLSINWGVRPTSRNFFRQRCGTTLVVFKDFWWFSLKSRLGRTPEESQLLALVLLHFLFFYFNLFSCKLTGRGSYWATFWSSKVVERVMSRDGKCVAMHLWSTSS